MAKITKLDDSQPKTEEVAAVETLAKEAVVEQERDTNRFNEQIYLAVVQGCISNQSIGRYGGINAAETIEKLYPDIANLWTKLSQKP